MAKPMESDYRGHRYLSYDLDETEIVFGQHLTTRYHGTDTWLRREREVADRRQSNDALLRRPGRRPV